MTSLRLKRSAILLLLSVWAAPAALAQQQGGSPPPVRQIIRVTPAPRKNLKAANDKATPVAKASPAPTPEAADKDDFMEKFNRLFGENGKLQPKGTPKLVTNDNMTSAEQIAELAKQMQARKPSPSGPGSWIRDATPNPKAYVAPTQTPNVRQATPPPKSNLPSIDFGARDTTPY